MRTNRLLLLNCLKVGKFRKSLGGNRVFFLFSKLFVDFLLEPVLITFTISSSCHHRGLQIKEQQRRGYEINMTQYIDIYKRHSIDHIYSNHLHCTQRHVLFLNLLLWRVLSNREIPYKQILIIKILIVYWSFVSSHISFGYVDKCPSLIPLKEWTMIYT